MAATFHAMNFGLQNASLSSFSITCTISTGDSVVVAASWNSASTTTPTAATTGGTGSDTLTLVYGPFTYGSFKIAGWLLQSAGAGRTGVTVSWASSNPAFADGFAWSFSGLASPTLDGSARANDNGSTVHAVSVNTATLQSADEFAVGYCCSGGAVNNSNAPWTSDGQIPDTGSFGEHQILTATTAIFSSFESEVPWFTFCMTFMSSASVAFVLGDYTLDNGLTGLDTVCDKIFVCAAAPTSYSDATSGANSLGSKNWGAGAAFGSAAARSGGGRQITSTAITDGSISTNGTVAAWAAVDSANSRLLAYGGLTGGKAVTVGQVFTLGAMTFGIPNT